MSRFTEELARGKDAALVLMGIYTKYLISVVVSSINITSGASLGVAYAKVTTKTTRSAFAALVSARLESSSTVEEDDCRPFLEYGFADFPNMASSVFLP